MNGFTETMINKVIEDFDNVEEFLDHIRYLNGASHEDGYFEIQDHELKEVIADNFSSRELAEEIIDYHRALSAANKKLKTVKEFY